MSLATVIRMEFAYPGVGILAGDSIQYLSIATAHGVIMVFFMIMPAIFGAFGNFLLPTQLGVHDVAFPRLNSAAFWFLPGGLIMLCQLVCVDRRYQRMNCFNIRELQGILKRKFFTDLVNTSDSHKATESTLINMRHKNNMSNILLYDQSLLYNFDLTNTSKFKNFSFSPGKVYTYSPSKSTFSFLPNNTTLILPSAASIYSSFLSVVKSIISFVSLPSIYTFMELPKTLMFLPKALVNSLFVHLPLNPTFTLNLSTSTTNEPLNMSYNSSTLTYRNFSINSPMSFADNSTSWRFNRYSYPLISYDYKSGNYLSI
jgi:hypothetical protein